MADGSAFAEPAIDILSETINRGYAIAGHVRSEAPFEGRATLEIARIGAGGTVRTRQAGTLDLSSDSEVVFARSRLSAEEGDVIDATAVLYDRAGAELSRFSIRLD